MKASLLCYLVESIGQSRFICQVSVLIFKTSLLCYLGGSFSQSRFICQVLCTGIQGISALVLGGPLANVVHLPSFMYWYSRYLCSGTGGSISQSRFICQVLCTGIQGISALVLGEHWPKKVHLPNLSSLAVLCFASQKVFSYYIQKT